MHPLTEYLCLFKQHTSFRLKQSIKEVVTLVVDEEEGGEVDHVNLPDGLHTEFRIFQALHLLDVLLGQDGSRTTDGAQVEASVLLAGIGHLLRAVTLGQRDHGASGIHEGVQVGIHAASSSGTERARSHTLGGLGGTGVVNDVVLHVLGHGLTAVQTLLDLGVSDITADNDGTGEAETRLHRVLADGGQDLLHGLVQIDLHRGVRLILAVLLQEAAGIVLQLLHEQTFLRDLRETLHVRTPHKTYLTIRRAGNTDTHRAGSTMTTRQNTLQNLPRQADHADIVAEVLAAELRANAHLAGHLQNGLLHLQVTEAATVLVTGSVEVVQVLGRGELHGLQVGFSGSTTDDESEVVRRTGSSAQTLDLGFNEGHQSL